MPVIDVTTFDFSAQQTREHTPKALTASVCNNTAGAVLHVGILCQEQWIDVFPLEFALASGEIQTLSVTLLPHKATGVLPRNAEITVYGQYLMVSQGEITDLPADIELPINIILPQSLCPHCSRPLPDSAVECRQCGERLRSCPVCGTSNSWLVRVCRANSSHVLRPDPDWTTSPGGSSSRSLALTRPLQPRLSRSWSVPQFPNPHSDRRLEWCAPIAAFGMVLCSAIDPITGRASAYAFDISNGSELWEFELPGGQGIYPDQGSLSVDEETGTLYAATLGGAVLGVDSIRGTLLWTIAHPDPIYAAPLVSQVALVIALTNRLVFLNKSTGEQISSILLNSSITGGICADSVAVYAACSDNSVSAVSLDSRSVLWRIETSGRVRAPLIVGDGTLFVSTADGVVFAVSTVTGDTLWKKQIATKSIAAAAALSVDGLMYVPADDGIIHVIDAKTGNMVRSPRVSTAPLRCAPVVSARTVFIGSDDGCIYAMDDEYHVDRIYETSPGTRISTAGIAIYGTVIGFTATDGTLYVLQSN